MPLTVSHPAAVLPLRRLGLPMTALVVGSMVPDIPLFLGSRSGYLLTHGPAGVLLVDPVVSVLVLAVWCWLVRDALVDLSPTSVRRRLPPTARLAARQWLLAPVAAVVGALTHVAWDAFTHPNRWGDRQFVWLQVEHAGLPGHQWVQHVSGVAGLLVVCAAAVAHLRSLPVTTAARPDRVLGPGVLYAVVAVAALTAAIAAASAFQAGVPAAAFRGVVRGLTALVCGVVLASLAWRVAAARRRRQGPPAQGRPPGARDRPAQRPR